MWSKGDHIHQAIKVSLKYKYVTNPMGPLSCVARQPLSSQRVNLPSCVARRQLCHKVNLPRFEARRRHLIMTCDIFGARQTNTLTLFYLFVKTYKPAHSSATLESLKSTRSTKLLEKLLT